jgi:hypothetical protein
LTWAARASTRTLALMKRRSMQWNKAVLRQRDADGRWVL